jgi:predicted flavoprotein YhiN
VTGSDGAWLNIFRTKGIACEDFQPSNAGAMVDWDQQFLKDSEGKAVKNISLTCEEKTIKGEFVVTSRGIEGGPVYALNRSVREQLARSHRALLLIDLKPELHRDDVEQRILARGNKSVTQQLKNELGLTDVKLSLLKTILSKEDFSSPGKLADAIKALPVSVKGLNEIDEAISTAGGIALHEIDAQLGLKKLKDHYVIGEMTAWDAPTGGYLLQACFSMGHFLAEQLNRSI